MMRGGTENKHKNREKKKRKSIEDGFSCLTIYTQFKTEKQ